MNMVSGEELRSMAGHRLTDRATVQGFGREWTTFDQSGVNHRALEATFDRYFALFPWDALSERAIGIDVGCGTGRWARFVAPRVGRLLCVDPSEPAADVARRTLSDVGNVDIQVAAAGGLPVADASLDFGYAIGVLHHMPDPAVGLRDCARVLKPGAPFLVYLYYALDNRPVWFRALWRATDAARRGISRLPFRARYWLTQALAALVYWPLARAARLAESLGISRRRVELAPLSFYRHKPFYIMRNDALDRFGTRVEHRYTRQEVRRLMEDTGFCNVVISPDPPYWCAVGRTM
jgi:SAM-dependent methyltransferase